MKTDKIQALQAVLERFVREADALPFDVTPGEAMAAWRQACEAAGRPELALEPSRVDVILGGFARGMLVGQAIRRRTPRGASECFLLVRGKDGDVRRGHGAKADIERAAEDLAASHGDELAYMALSTMPLSEAHAATVAEVARKAPGVDLDGVLTVWLGEPS